ncbi:hypothetical protein FG379_001304 [Cryptosporidium bovis]|uniref:uncharacterized protein n=1 Tax=Cryptosporidium bovis TaxID=310047 RepID=UPI003519E44C|nr:hypothetical protein FG379_001304 [Cryptosporidium bovis]
MFPNLECRLYLKTNKYLPEIPSNWLENDHFPIFNEHGDIVCTENSNLEEQKGDIQNILSNPFISANYSEDGEVIVVISLNGIYLLGAYTRTCFSAVSYSKIENCTGTKEKIMFCKDACVFGYKNQFLFGVFNRFVCFWDVSFRNCIVDSDNKNNTGYSKFVTPTYIGSFSFEDVINSYIEDLMYMNDDIMRNNVILSIQGIRVYYNESSVDIEFLVEFSHFVPLLVKVSHSYALINCNNENNNIKITNLCSVFPNKLFNIVYPTVKDIEHKGNINENRVLSISVNNNEENRIYSVVFYFNDKHYICLFRNKENIIGLKSIPNYGKRQVKFLRNCKTMFNQIGDLFIIQFPDRFSIYNITCKGINEKGEYEFKNCLNEDDDTENDDYSEFGLETGKLEYNFTLLYTYTQIIQKEWITSIAIYKDKASTASKETFYGPVNKLYPCGIISVSTISSNGQCFYYIMKVCSYSDERSYIGEDIYLPCKHHCKDNTGSNMIIWKIELTKLNGIRKLVWQPGESSCLAIQFIDRLKNTKLHYDDFIELCNFNEDNLNKNSIHQPFFGNIFFLESNNANDDMLLWSRLMTDFTAIYKNREYIEKDDEFDVVSSGSFDEECSYNNDFKNYKLILNSNKYFLDNSAFYRNTKRIHYKQVVNMRSQIKSLTRFVEDNEDLCNNNGYSKTSIEWITKNEDTRKQYILNFDLH